jgi:phosphate transport system substrate-binding protein
MINSRKLRTTALIAALLLVFVIGGCSNSPAPAPQQPAAPAELAGTIQMAGSTSVQPLSEELAKAFMAKNTKVRINIAGGGSGAGIKAAQDGTAGIGASSRELKAEEASTVKAEVIAWDGIAVVVHKDNAIADLTVENIKKIFAGEITDWKDLGGAAGTIHVFSREEGSGTRGAFEELVMGGTPVTDKAGVQTSTGAIRTAVAGDVNGIGYISLGGLNADVKAVKVEGVAATIDNVKSQTYKIYRPFLYLTKNGPEDLVKAYYDFVLGGEGQEIVASNGFITVK